MAEKPRAARDFTVARTLAWFVAAYGVAAGVGASHVGESLRQLLVHKYPDSWMAISQLYWLASEVIGASYMVGLGGATIAAAGLLLLRTLARARARAGFADPLDRVRRLTAKRPRVMMGLAAVPAVGWALALGARAVHLLVSGSSSDIVLPALLLPAALALVAHIALTRIGWRALVAPTLKASEAGGEEVTADGFTFNAVAVTKQTLGLVGALAAISVVMAVLAYILPTPTLVRNPAFMAALFGYLGLAVGGTALFRRASRISVGLDGIYISGSARAQFFPFSEVDTARANGSNLELVRGERVVLRLQLHGEDALRRDALAERLRSAITCAEAQRDEPAVGFVRTASADALERAAGGAATYREAAPSREKLWEMLESPAVDAHGRKAAAAALAREGDVAERARLRVAAEQCAEPSVRARIKELLEDDHVAADEIAAGPRKARLARAH